LVSGNTSQANILLSKTNYVPALYSANALAKTTGLKDKLGSNLFTINSYQKLISDSTNSGIIENYKT
jgi:hypothetical protein